MADLPTIGALSITDGRLMGEIETVYDVVSFFLGRPAFTHELPKYGDLAEPILIGLFPDLATDQDAEWEAVRDSALDRFGHNLTVPDDLAGVLSDGVGPTTNLADMLKTKDPANDRPG